MLDEAGALSAEGIAVVRLSPFRRRHLPGVQAIADLLEPLDRAIRNLRVLVRRAAIATWRDEPVPPTATCGSRASPRRTDDIAASWANAGCRPTRGSGCTGSVRRAPSSTPPGAVGRGDARPDPLDGGRPADAHRAAATTRRGPWCRRPGTSTGRPATPEIDPSRLETGALPTPQLAPPCALPVAAPRSQPARGPAEGLSPPAARSGR